jgi:hypothetical protein
MMKMAENAFGGATIMMTIKATAISRVGLRATLWEEEDTKPASRDTATRARYDSVFLS